MKIKNSEPLVSIIIPTHNREKFLLDCIDSLLNLDYPKDKYEIFVINDGHILTNNILKDIILRNEVRSIFYCSVPLRIINIGIRLGAAKARNFGIKEARGEIIAFVDDDVIVHKDWLKNLIKAYSLGQRIGGVGGRIVSSFSNEEYYSNEPIGTIGWSGHTYMNFNIFRRSKVDWIRGCNMSFRKCILDKLGGFDESLDVFSHSEDIDISLRARSMSYELVYEPTAVVIHRHAPTGGIRTSPIELAYWVIRNSSYVFLKNCKMPKKIVAVLRCFLGNCSLCIHRAARTGNLNLNTFSKILHCAIRGLIGGIVLSRKKHPRCD